jgi:hypothetical protein
MNFEAQTTVPINEEELFRQQEELKRREQVFNFFLIKKLIYLKKRN